MIKTKFGKYPDVHMQACMLPGNILATHYKPIDYDFFGLSTFNIDNEKPKLRVLRLIFFYQLVQNQ